MNPANPGDRDPESSPFSNWPELPEDDDKRPAPGGARENGGGGAWETFAEGGDEDVSLTPEMQAALEALLSEPFPQRPYSLIPAGGEQTPEYTDYIIHKDVDTEHQCVFVFDSIVDAFAVAEEYKTATGRDAEPIEIDIFSLDEDRFWVKFYRANGLVAILSLPEYRRHMGLTRGY